MDEKSLFLKKIVKNLLKIIAISQDSHKIESMIKVKFREVTE